MRVIASMRRHLSETATTYLADGRVWIVGEPD